MTPRPPSERYTVPYPPHGSAEWHRVRWADEELNRRMPASEAACMWDRHEFVTAGAKAAEQLADHPPPANEEPNESMARGVALEDALAQHWAQADGSVVRRPTVLFCRGRAIATIDRLIYPAKRSRRAEALRHLEVKTSNHRFNPDAPLPDQWFWQGVAQAYCRGSELVEWVILDGRLRIHHYTQVVTDAALEAFAERLDWWMTWIDMGLVPEGVTLSYDDQVVRFGRPDPDSIVVLDYASDVRAQALDRQRQYESIRLAEKQLEVEKDGVKAWFAEQLGDREALYVADVFGFDPAQTKPIVTWKAGTRTALNTKRLKEDELYDKYAETSDTRTMLIKPPEV